MASDAGAAWVDRISRVGGRTAAALAGPRDTWLPALAILLPAVAWLALEGRAYPRFEPFQTGDYAKIELYTRLAAEGSQRVGTESRFHIHQPGPTFFYAAAPPYTLLGGTTRAMAVATLAWNALFVVLLLREASRLAPGTGPLLASLLLAVLVDARGLGMLLSPWNPHVGLLPFGVMLLASARLASGDARALALVVLGASVALQSQMAWALGIALPAGAGLALLLLPALRRRLFVPTLGLGLRLRPLLAALLVAGALWALPVIDELTGEYRNFHRIFALRQEPRAPTPWLATLQPAAAALNLRRDGEPPESAFAFGARNLGYDPRMPPAAVARYPPPGPGHDTSQALVVALALVAAGSLAARRRAPAAALAVIAAVAFAAAPAAVRYMPGRAFPPYLFMWGAMATFAACLVVLGELLARVPGLASRRVLGAVLLLSLPPLLVARAWRTQPLVAGPRDARSVMLEAVTSELKARAAADLPAGRRFLLRIAPYEDQFTAIGLILALDKAGLRFGVEPFGSCRVEGRFAPRGDEWAELLVGNLPAREGASRIGPPDGPSFVWQAPWKR
jgi:hypothetical protein